jgi:predicted ATP-binding protein involved in virulence
MAKTTKKVVAKQGRSDESPEVSPVYFLSLEVANILCFKDLQVLSLTDKQGNPAQWTVILGDNGVGKTTLLRCLAGMEIQEWSGGYEPLLSRQPDYLEDWLEDSQAQFSSYTNAPETKLVGAFSLQTNLSAFSDEHCQQKQLGEITLKIDWGPLKIHWGLFCHMEIPSSSANGLVCYGYGAIRRSGSLSLTESLESPNSLGLFEEGSPLINAEEWLLQTDYASRTASGKIRDRLEKQFNQVTEILQKILPDVDDIKIAPATEDNPHPRAEFLTPYGWVHINSLGLGYRTAIAWMVDLAVRLFRRYPNSPDPLAEPAIVLVDEIDLHLHPRWQRTIMDFLTERFPNTQFIVTAHSPLVVQAAQNANIVLLRREGDRVVIDNDPEIIENWRVDQVLTSVFDLQTARPKEVEPLLLRRETLLDKSKLSKKDQAELDKITAQLGDLPTAESPQEIKAMNIIRRAAKYLESK